jgi:hypothetical protein
MLCMVIKLTLSTSVMVVRLFLSNLSSQISTAVRERDCTALPVRGLLEGDGCGVDSLSHSALDSKRSDK